MREVSCRILEMFFREIEKKAIPAARLIEGTGLPLAHFRDKQERIDWSTFVRMMENARTIWTDDELVAMGGAWIDSPFLRHIRLIASTLVEPKRLYGWFDTTKRDRETSERKVRKGLGTQMFTNVSNTVTDLGPDRVRLDVTLPEGDAPCPAFFLLTKGGYVDLPRLVNAPRATVEMLPLPRGARYEVRLAPNRPSRLGRLRQAAAWMVNPAAAAVEMEETHSALQARYEQLERARQELELRVVERTAELSATTAELAGTVRALEDAKESRDRIFANVNHDLRSPLALVLLSIAEARAHGELSPAAERSIASIEHGARRVLRMVDELMLLAEGREGEVRLWQDTLDLGAMVAAAVRAWTPAAAAAGLSLSADVAPDVLVHGDTNALERVLANLVSNAIKFTPHGGAVRVTLAREDETAVLHVADTGRGIDDELKTRLFGRFERGATSTQMSGSGLGLALVKELVEAHGGTVTVADAVGGGADFRITLPARAGHAEVPATLPPRRLRPEDFGLGTTAEGDTLPRTYEPTTGIAARATILLAEDDPDLRDRTAALLARDYRVIAVPNGAVALELAMKTPPDLLITDVQMPEMDGFELTRRFRALPNNRLSPVLVLTTFGAARDRLAGFEAGAVDYIQKPFEPLELRARVRSQLTVRSLALQLLETEKLAALGTLSAGLAHEIRNPANGIINAVGPLRELLPPDAIEPGSPAAQLLDVVEHCSRQVAGMSRQLLGFKRNVEPKRLPVPIDRLVARVCTTVRPCLEGVELREVLDYTGPVECAEPLLAQVLTNLVNNGAQAAGRGGWVEIRTALDDGRVVVEVRDSGPGVPVELRERIFEPFFTTKPAGSGTGLGLSTARDIVLRHGGTLDVRTAGDRSVFRMEIPPIS